MIILKDPSTTSREISMFRMGELEELPEIMNAYFLAPAPTDQGQQFSLKLLRDFMADVQHHPAFVAR